MKQASESETLHRMAAYCSSAERCIQDVRRKVELAGMTPEASDRIIARLVKEKFIDERRFAGSFVNDKLRFNKWGRVKISYELSRKGIPQDCREEALEAIDEEKYFDILCSVLKEKMKTMKTKGGHELFAKLLRFAAGRGFESRETITCLRQLLNTAEDGEYLD